MTATLTDATTTGYITADRCSTLTAGPQTKSTGNYAPTQNIANSSPSQIRPVGMQSIPMSLDKASMAPS